MIHGLFMFFPMMVQIKKAVGIQEIPHGLLCIDGKDQRWTNPFSMSGYHHQLFFMLNCEIIMTFPLLYDAPD